MTALIGALLIAAVLWKGYQLSRAPEDLPLRSVTLCLMSALLAWPFGTAAAARATDRLVAPGTAELLQNVLLLCCVYWLMCFYLHSASDPAAGRRRARLEAVPLTVAAALATLSMAMTPVEERGATYDTADMQVDGVAGFYLAAGVYLGYALGMALWWTRKYARMSQGPLAIGLRLTAVSMAAMVFADAVRQVYVVVRWAGGPHASPVLVGGNIVLQIAIPLFLVGVSYPGVASRIAALRLWLRHLRAYHRLRPLWTALHRVFPEDELTRMPGGLWGDRFLLRGVHRRYYRRVIECRDGLVRLSPYLAQAGKDAPPAGPGGDDDGWAQELAERLRRALRAYADGVEVPPQAVPVGLPNEETLDGDARRLVALSDAFATAS